MGPIQALQEAPPSEVRTWTFSVNDEATGEPIAGAWVVFAAPPKAGEYNSRSASSGFTASDGQLSLQLPTSKNWPSGLQVQGPQHAHHWPGLLRAAGSKPTAPKYHFDIALKHDPSVRVFWGKLDSKQDLGGLEVAGSHGGRRRIALCSKQGLFALALNPDSGLSIRASDERIEPLHWSLNPSVLGSAKDPVRIPMDAECEVLVQAAPDSPALTDGLAVSYYRLAQRGQAQGWIEEWGHEPGAPFKLITRTQSPYLIVATDNGRWGMAVGPKLNGLEPIQITLPPRGTHTITVHLKTQGQVSHIPAGNLKLLPTYPYPTPSEYEAPELLHADIGLDGTVTFQNVQKGSYELVWGEEYGQGSLMAFVHDDTRDTRVEMLVPATPLIQRPNATRGTATLTGRVDYAGFDCTPAVLTLSGYSGGSFGAYTTADSHGNFSFTGVPGGIMRIRVARAALVGGGGRLHQLEGDLVLLVDQQQIVIQEPIQLYSPCSVMVHAVRYAPGVAPQDAQVSGVFVLALQGEQIVAQGVTGEQGWVILTDLPSSECQIVIAGPHAPERSVPVFCSPCSQPSPPSLYLGIQ